jgi:hypothetical protein
MKNVYDTGKVKIGLLYEPTKFNSEIGIDASRLQAALLDGHKVYSFGERFYVGLLLIAALFVAFAWVTK